MHSKKGKVAAIISFFITALIATLFVCFYLNRVVIMDFFKGLDYQPTLEMQQVRGSLDLTNFGRNIFNAVHPVLQSRSEFNLSCDSGDELISVLGCYRYDTIFVYDIDSEDFPGFYESTTAHELLHAVWHRMSDEEHTHLMPLIEQTYIENTDELADVMEIYNESERYDELFVRLGVQISELPDELEESYAKVFNNRASIVAYYDSFRAPFEELQARLEALDSELKTQYAEIEKMNSDYTSQLEAYNAAVGEFNACSRTTNCFNQYTFSARRAELVAQGDALNAYYDRINEAINSYNQKVEEYEKYRLRNNELESIVNSNSKLENNL